MKSTPYWSELTFAKDLALQAGEIMRTHFSQSIKTSLKSNITPVTVADIEINSLVIKSIHNAFPEHAVIAEEESVHNDKSEYVWICDPLDGTIPYSIGMPTSVFSLALYKKHTFVLGVVYDPYMSRLYHTIGGSGSFLNGENIHVASGPLEPGDCAGIILFDPGILNAHTLINPLLQKEIRIMQIQSFVYTLSYIATGHLKAAVLSPAHIWDRAASVPLLKNAGGMVTDEQGTELDIFCDTTQMVVASNGQSHEEIINLVKSAFLK